MTSTDKHPVTRPGWRQGRFARLQRHATAILAGMLLYPATLHGQGCGSAGRFTAELWDTYLAGAREAGCLAPTGGPLKWAACAINTPTMALHMVDRMVGWWNAAAQGGWATLGPRRLAPTWQTGTLLQTSGRLFVGTAPVHSSTTVYVQKLEGRADAEVVICAVREDGSTRRLASYRFVGDRDNRGKEQQIFSFPDLTADLITVKLDAKDADPTKKFQYKIKVETEPVKFDEGPVRGFADLHLHQAAELGFGGNQLHGSHTGSQARALKADPGPYDAIIPELSEWMSGHALPDAMIGEAASRHGGGYPGFERWPHFNDVTHQQVHEDWLKAAHEGGLNLVVVSAVSFEPWCFMLKVVYPRPGDRMGCRDMENVERQLKAFIAMDEKHDWYEIAVHPWHARKIINEGKLAVVLSMEVSNLFPRGEGHFITQLDRLWGMGLRTLQLAHETDSRFSGAAPHRGIFEVTQAIKWPMRALATQYERFMTDQDNYELGASGFYFDENGKNRMGLSSSGVDLVEGMINRRMLIDVAHLSERALEDVYQLVANRHKFYPLYNSHTRFKTVLTQKDLGIQREFLTTDAQIRYMRETGGMVGLRTGLNAIMTVIGDGEDGVKNDCDGSSKSLAQLLLYGKQNRIPMGFGTDFNGFINQLGPRYGPEKCPAAGDEGMRTDQAGAPRAECPLAPDAKVGPRGRDFDTEGLRHIGYLPDLVSDLEALKAPGVNILKSSAEAFLLMWERAYDPKRSRIGADVDLAGEIAGTVKPWTPCDLYRGPAALLADLSGDWVRVVSNNRPYDRMRITVGAGQAVLTALPPGAREFSVGQVIWSDMAPDGSLKVRGSDGAYYASTLTMEGADRINIDVDHTGAGHDQTWERAGPSIDGEWELYTGGGQGNQGIRVRVEGDRAILRYLPSTSSQSFRTGAMLWRDIGRGDNASAGRLVAHSPERVWQDARFTLIGDGDLELVLSADSSVQRWGRPGRPPVSAMGPLRGPTTLGVGPEGLRSGIATRLGPLPTFDLLAVEASARLPAVITGMVFRDLDGNGEHDVGEPGLAGVRVSILDASGKATQVTTDTSGVYRFESSSGGQFRLSLDASSMPLREATTFPEEHEVEVDRGFTTPAVNFVVRLGRP